MEDEDVQRRNNINREVHQNDNFKLTQFGKTKEAIRELSETFVLRETIEMITNSDKISKNKVNHR